MPLAIVTLTTLPITPTPPTPLYLLSTPESALPSLPNENFPAAAQQTTRCGDGVGGGGEGYPRWSVGVTAETACGDHRVGVGSVGRSGQ